MGGSCLIARVLVLVTSARALSMPSTALPFGANQSNVRATAGTTTTSTSGLATLQRVAVVGGGPAGALMTLYLSQIGGFEVDLFEASEESEVARATSRSWNVILFDRGCDALERGGFDLLKEAGDLVVTVTGSVRHNAKKKLGVGLALGTKSIGRGDLAGALLTKARGSPNVNVHFGCMFSTMDTQKRVAKFERGDGNVLETSFDMLVGADGVNSRVRQALQDHKPGFTVREREGPKAFKTIRVPIMQMEDAEETWKSCAHTSNSKKGLVVGSPRSDGVVTASVILPKESKKTFETLMKTTEDVRNYFGSNHPGLFGPNGPSEEVAKDFLQRRPRRLRTIYCSQLAVGSVVLIGDAAHAMEASLGQGVNSALEDCQVLAHALTAGTESTGAARVCDIPRALEAFNKLRLGDAHAVCEVSEIGAALTARKTLAAQFIHTSLLNKTLGRLAPKVFPPPSLFTVNEENKRYGAILRGIKREATVAKWMTVASIALILGGLAARTIRRM
ncbi:unnamed protein product [Scytosiphon promiscuus]